MISWPAQTYVYILDSCSVNDISDKLGELYGEVYQNIAMQGVIPTSQPFARYERFPMQAGDNDVIVLKAGTFIETVIETEGRLQLATSQEGNTLQASHFGVYETLGKRTVHCMISLMIKSMSFKEALMRCTLPQTLLWKVILPIGKPELFTKYRISNKEEQTTYSFYTAHLLQTRRR